MHNLLLDCSYVTSKRKVAFDGSLLYKGTKGLRKDFVYCFVLLNHGFKVVEGKRSLDLYIDSLSFKQVYASTPIIPRPPSTLPARIYEDWPTPPPPKLEERKSPPKLSADFLELDDRASQIFSPIKAQPQRDIFAAPKVQMKTNAQEADLLDF